MVDPKVQPKRDKNNNITCNSTINYISLARWIPFRLTINSNPSNRYDQIIKRVSFHAGI